MPLAVGPTLPGTRYWGVFLRRRHVACHPPYYRHQEITGCYKTGLCPATVFFEMMRLNVVVVKNQPV
jgi:hypothetical protein